MSAAKTPDYQLTQDFDEKLKRGTFVNPIREEYLPRGWRDYVPNSYWYVREKHSVCMTPIGLRIIDKKIIAQV